jgi:hypothetical protein
MACLLFLQKTCFLRSFFDFGCIKFQELAQISSVQILPSVIPKNRGESHDAYGYLWFEPVDYAEEPLVITNPPETFLVEIECLRLRRRIRRTRKSLHLLNNDPHWQSRGTMRCQ